MLWCFIHKAYLNHKMCFEVIIHVHVYIQYIHVYIHIYIYIYIYIHILYDIMLFYIYIYHIRFIITKPKCNVLSWSTAFKSWHTKCTYYNDMYVLVKAHKGWGWEACMRLRDPAPVLILPVQHERNQCFK